MKGKQAGRQPRARNFQAEQNLQQNDCGQAVKQNVRQVVAEDRVAPKFVLYPENAMDERIVLPRRAEMGPDLHQTLP